MAFKKGQSGNPGGRKTEKLIKDALMLSLNEECPVTQKRKLRKITDKLVEKAENGDVTAIKEIFDRVEGKPAQAITNGDDGPLEIIVRRFAPTDNTE